MGNALHTFGVNEDAETELFAKFQSLVADWKAARGHCSSVNAWANIPSYRAIVALGYVVVPLLLHELEARPDHWFWALKEITGENPVSSEDRGNVNAMAKSWLAWGKAKGIGGER